ncbi:MAG TPA: bifunctional nicotinamidase/pyrazinamidase [Chlamydiales bacterium]|nr:bifunctional nicotinamidase/pyrazinamidase [Chlamydiales bacterium]
MKKALIITDMQRDFMPGGALGVSGANHMIPMINQLMLKFSHVLAVRDFHPINHVSFASTHGKRVGETVTVGASEQILWPDHCVQGTRGAELADGLSIERIEAIFNKGTDPSVDSYSAFFDSKRHQSTGLEKYLKNHKLQDLYFVGVATDYCILYSVLDALALGFIVSVIIDACRAINRKLGDEKKSIDIMQSKGAQIIESLKVF